MVGTTRDTTTAFLTYRPPGEALLPYNNRFAGGRLHRKKKAGRSHAMDGGSGCTHPGRYMDSGEMLLSGRYVSAAAAILHPVRYASSQSGHSSTSVFSHYRSSGQVEILQPSNVEILRLRLNNTSPVPGPVVSQTLLLSPYVRRTLYHAFPRRGASGIYPSLTGTRTQGFHQRHVDPRVPCIHPTGPFHPVVAPPSQRWIPGTDATATCAFLASSSSPFPSLTNHAVLGSA
ncbi:hypothetical protein EV126DRAFT_24117 [Verticillium dahliae]|nr:hypothetical protein EV126DRAFT_24117 [Verticillium dahliae]